MERIEAATAIIVSAWNDRMLSTSMQDRVVCLSSLVARLFHFPRKAQCTGACLNVMYRLWSNLQPRWDRSFSEYRLEGVPVTRASYIGPAATMVSTRVKSQPKSSPRGSSVASTPRAGRRLTPASVTPKKRAAVAPTATKSKAKAVPKKRVKVDSDGDEDATPSEQSSSDDDDSEDAFNPDSSASEEEIVEEEEESDIDSDFLDEDEEESASRKKRKSGAKGAGGSAKKARGSIGGGKKAVQVDDDLDEDPILSDVELEDGQTVAGRIYPAPTTGQGTLQRANPWRWA